MKKSISLILAAMMLLSMFVLAPVTASAAESGTVGDCNYTLSPYGNLIITDGTEITADSYGNYPWDSYKSSIKTIGIGSGIKTIGANAFKDCTKVTSVAFSLGLEQMFIGAFKNNTSLTSISFPTSVTLIGPEAFFGCTSLSDITIPDGTKARLGIGAFVNTAATSVYVPASVTTIDNKSLGYSYADSNYSRKSGFSISTMQGTAAYDYAVANSIPIQIVKIISSISLSVTAPLAGATPDTATFTITEGVSVYGNKLTWYDRTGDKELKSTDVFQENHVYGINLQLDVKSGYRFAVTEKGSTDVTATVNGKAAGISGSSATPTSKIYLSNSFDALESEVISNVNITGIIEPSLGKKINFTTFNIPDSVMATTGKLDWWIQVDNYTPVAGDTFQLGKQYTVFLLITAKPGYKFATKDGSTRNNVTSTINGKTSESQTLGDYDPAKTIRIAYKFPKVENPIISSVAVTGVTTPVGGTHPSFNVTLPAHVSASSVRWSTSGSPATALKSGDYFESGKTYYLEIFAVPDSGYQFEVNDGKIGVTATFNGATANVMGVSGSGFNEKLYFSKQYTASNAQFTTYVSVTDVVEPAAGAKPVYTATVATSGNTLDHIEWYNSTDSKTMTSSSVFEAGKKYTANIYIAADEGREFYTTGTGDLNVTASVNGRSAGIIQIQPNGSTVKLLHIYYVFTCPTPAVTTINSINITNVITPAVGAKVTYEDINYGSGFGTAYNTCYSSFFYDETDKNTMFFNDPFVAGKQYSFNAILQASEGYAFAVDGEGNPAVNVTVNGKKANVKTYSAYDADEAVFVEYFFDALPEPTEPDTLPTEGTEPTTEPDTLPTEPATEATEPETEPTAPTEPATEATEPATEATEATAPTADPTPSNNIKNFKVTGVKEKTYTGKAITQKITVKDLDGNVLVKDTDYIVTYSKNKNVGTATMIITAIGDYEGTIMKNFKIVKADNPMTVKTAVKSVKLKDIKKKAVTVKGTTTVSKAQGKVSYKLTSIPKDLKKLTTISSKGVITIKKWAKAKKGTYKFKVKVTAKGDSNYKSKDKTVEVKIKVK